MAAPIPKKIGKYDVLDVIGKGGMGIVYRAKDPFLDRMVAIKIMTISYADYPDLLQRFYREAKATANLQHPNIVTVYELGEHEGSPYLAMQYLEGSSLEVMLRTRQELSLLQKIDVVIQACHGLSYAHQRGIVHRDIKPGNIMVLKDGSVKIVDFGIARIGDTNFTRTGQFMGSLNYMSLEQLNDKLTVDQRTDVYSTGVVLYQVLTGSLPFEADSTGATLMKILNEAPPPFSKYISGYPPELETITLKALAKDRDQRYGSADEFALDLTQLLDRLKHDQIGVHLQQAKMYLQQNSLFQANDELLQILKLDKQHTQASALLRDVRKRIEKEQSAERSRQLREQAQEAFGREDFDPALGFIDQAISLDTTNVDLQQFRSKVQSAKAEIEQLRQVMQRAENAHRAGNLDTAKQAIEEVLARRPNDTRVKSLYRMIQKELDERLKQKRMEQLLDSARKEMSNRRYTAAFDLLQEAEKVDPDAPALRSLMESFTAAREQEQRRRALEKITREAEQALNTDDHQAALNLLSDGLQRFPGEPALLKLKDLAETQKQTAQMKSYVRERIAAAREILNAGNASGALKVLQDAQKKAPGNLQLESLVSIVQERLAQDRDDQAKARCVQEANDAVSRRDYDEAIQVLEAGQVRFAASPEIDNLLRFAREQQAKQAKQQEIEKSVRRAQEFLRNQEYDKAITLLESIVARNDDEELRIVLEEARRRRDDLNRQIAGAIARGQQFLNEGSPARAVEFLEGQPTAFRRSEEFRELLMTAANQHQTAQEEILPPPEPELPEPDLGEAPEPLGTMVWDGRVGPRETGPREIEPLPRVSTGRVTVPPKVAPEEVEAPVQPAPVRVGLLQKLTPQQKLYGGIGVGVLFVLLIWLLIPGAKPGTLTIHSNIEGASVFVDGKFKGTIDGNHELKIELPAHIYAIEARKDGFESASGQALIKKGEEFPLSLNLTPTVVAMGSLSVQTSEDGVDVYVDEQLRGTTRNKRLNLSIPPGHYVVRVEKSGFAPEGGPQSIELASNSPSALKFTLTKSGVGTTAAPKDSYLLITGTQGADVRVDGKSFGTITSTGIYAKVSADSPHRVEATLNGYKPFSQENVRVKQGDRYPLAANLERLPQPKAPASITSFSGPSAAIAPGQNARLTWDTKNASSVEISGIGPVQASGSADVKPSQTTKYTLTAKGEGGNDAREFTVNVVAPAQPPPAITAFNASSLRIKQGESVVLTWNTANASSVTINGLSVNPSGGSWSDRPADTTTYTLVANGNGSPATSRVAVTVEKPQVSQGGGESADTSAVKDALNRLSQAYSTQIVDEVKKEWVGMNKQEEKKLRDLFSNKALKAISIRFDSCSSPAISGDTATTNCTQALSYTAEGHRQTNQSSVSITLKRASGMWRVESLGK